MTRLVGTVAQPVTGSVYSAVGAPLAGVTVVVREKTSGAAAAVYSDPDLTVVLPTVATDGIGRFAFYTFPGDYTLTPQDPSALPLEDVEVAGVSGNEVQGPTGPPGAQGPQGSQGVPGPTGLQGPAGSQGPAGATGATGSQGPPGVANLTFRGPWNPSTAYIGSPSGPSDSVGYQGSSYFAIANNTNVAPPPPSQAPNAAWALLSAVGATGPQGPVGPPGIQGLQGPAGQQGAAGPAGPQGVVGAQGPQGPVGPQGPAGASLTFAVEDYVQAGDVNDSEAFNRLAVAVNAAGGGRVISRTGRQFIVQKQTLSGNGTGGSYVPAPLMAFSRCAKPVVIDGLDVKCAGGLHVGQFDYATGAVRGIVDYAVLNGGGNAPYTASLADIFTFDRCAVVALRNLNIDGNQANLVKGGGIGLVGDTSYEVDGTGISVKGATATLIQNVTVTGMISDNIEINDPDVTDVSIPHPVILDNVVSTYAGRMTLWLAGTNSFQARNSKFLYAGKGFAGASYAAAMDIESYAPKVASNLSFTDCDFGYARAKLASTTSAISSSNATFDRCRFYGTDDVSMLVGTPGYRFRSCKMFGAVGSLYGDADPTRATQVIDSLVTDRFIAQQLNLLDNAGAVTLTATARDFTQGTVSVEILTDGASRWRVRTYLDTGSGPVLQNDYRTLNTVNSAALTTLAADPNVIFADAGSPNANPVSQPVPIAPTVLVVLPTFRAPSSQTATAVNVNDQLAVPTVSVKQKNFTRTVAFEIAAGTNAGSWKLLVYVDAVAAAVETFDNLTGIAAAITATAGSLWVTLTNLNSGSGGANAYPVVTAKTTLAFVNSYASSALVNALPQNTLLERTTLDAYTVKPVFMTGQNPPNSGPAIFDRVTMIFRQTTADGAALADKASVALLRSPVEVRGYLNVVESYPTGFTRTANGFYIDAPTTFACYLYDSAGKATLALTPKTGVFGPSLSVSVDPGSTSGFRVRLYQFSQSVVAETYDNLATPAAAVTALAASALVTAADQSSTTTPPGNNPATVTLQRFPGLRIAAGSHVNVPGPVVAWGTWDPTSTAYGLGRVGPSDPPPLPYLPVNLSESRMPDATRRRPVRVVVGTAAPTTGWHELNDVVLNAAAGSTLCWVCTASGVPGTWVAKSVTTIGAPVTAFKAANTTRNNTNTKTADPDLTVTVAANAVYIVESWLGYEATTVADIAQSWSAPAGATMVWGSSSLVSNATSNISATSRQRLALISNSNTLGGVGAGQGVEARPSGLLTVAGTGGTFALTWAQSTAEVSDAILYAGSWLRLTQVA